MTHIKRIGLNKLFLWSEASRYQTYPQALARLQPGGTYTRQQIGAELFRLAAREDGRQWRDSQINNVFGFIQSSQDKLLLKGINLFQRVTPHGVQRIAGIDKWEQAGDTWQPTPAARVIGQAFAQEPASARWQQLLAEQLARYEPRTRMLLHLLAQGYRLTFEKPGYFAGNTLLARLVGPEDIVLFADNCAAFNQLLMAHKQLALGPWWLADITAAGFEVVDDFVLQGAMNRPPSTSFINSALKTALYLFYVSGILVEEDDGWRVDTDAFARHIHPEVSAELLGIQATDRPGPDNPWQQLSFVVNELADERGFVITAAAAERWGEMADVPLNERLLAFDNLVRRGLFEGRVEIVDRHLGQPRLGRGLFDDDNMRLVKLRVLA